MPKPPSFVALPPRPTMISFAPRFVASKIISPTPNVSRTNWIAFTFGKSPHASGFAHLHHRELFLVWDPLRSAPSISATERIVRLAFEPGNSRAHHTLLLRSPPRRRPSAPLRSARPAAHRAALLAMFCATSRAFSVPLNLSGATRIRTATISSPIQCCHSERRRAESRNL